MSEKEFLVIIGPSGVGKTSAVKALSRRKVLHPIPSWTTRSLRPGEEDERVDHIFVSEEEFERRSKAGFFLEEVRMFGLPYRYGLPKIEFKSDTVVPVLLLRASLVSLLRKHYSNYRIYQIEDSFERVAKRLRRREEQGEEQGERLVMYKKEIALGRSVADRIIENKEDLEGLSAKIEEYVRQDFKEIVT
ncbi:MAG TPA: hypothetical protein VFH06_01720 [Candidatus Saccharimonadales bacterium]|nr:hypothetical protein [Candidatus Saccharimonadales bacterium]